MEYEYILGGPELLDDVEPLWERLHAFHKSLSAINARRLAGATFASRKQGFIEKTAQGELRVELVRPKSGTEFTAYCVSTIVGEKAGDGGRTGEIDSIFVPEEHRGEGIADQLMKNSLAWMEAKGVERKVIVVLAGNEDVHAFYKRFGFSPMRTILTQD